jgi:hypothetical protein
MKTRIYLLFLLCGLGTAAQAQSTGTTIGINTENPQGLLHIDGATAPATTNPSTGVVNPAQAVDDIVVDASGRIGVGHLSPQAKMDVISSTPGGAIRIQDGTEGEGKILISNDLGIGSWAPLAGASWFAALYDSPLLGYTTTRGVRRFTAYADSVVSDVNLGSLNRAAGEITLPRTGKYRITLSIYWIANNSDGRTAPYPTQAILRVKEAGQSAFTDKAAFNFWSGRINYGVLPTFINILEFKAGDVLTVFTDETAAANANNAQAVLFMVELLL